jgi:hypothetical protein
MNDKDFMKWIYGRLVNVHNEPEDIDYMIRLRKFTDILEGEK